MSASRMADKKPNPFAKKDGATATADAPDGKGVEHAHAVAGGGSKTHTHPGGDGAHKHAAKYNLLPLPGDGPAQLMSTNMAESTALYALDFAETVTLGEGKPIPFLATGDWNFDEYGPLSVTQDDLRQVKTAFDTDVRRQRLPIINEAHDANRKVGHIKALDWDGPDRLVAIPEWTPLGEKLIADEAYDYTSPELEYRSMLLHNWADPEFPDVKHPTVGAGLALTNFPKMKKLGHIAASETAVACDLIACSEQPIGGATPMDAAVLLMAGDPDMDGDDDGTVPLCMYQPPVMAIGCCPGYTRRSGDTDGDGTCQFADAGCNGYRPAPAAAIAGLVGNPSDPTGFAPYMSEKTPKPADVQQAIANQQHLDSSTAPGATHMAEPTPTPDQAPAKPDGDVAAVKPDPAIEMAETKAKDLAAKFAESETRATALAAKFAESETERINLAERVAAMEREKIVTATRAKFSEYLRSGQITPAEVELLIPDDDAVVKMSELPSVLASIAARKPTIDFQERGTSGDEGAANPADAVVGMAEKIREAAPTMTKEQAFLAAIKADPNLAAAALNAPLA